MSTTGATVAIMETEQPGSPVAAAGAGGGVIHNNNYGSAADHSHGGVAIGIGLSNSSSNNSYGNSVEGASSHGEGELAPPVYGETGSGAFV
jgi:hypothetical protein